VTEVGYAHPQPRMGFFTDTSVCIGCKACEVACKEWNLVPAGAEPSRYEAENMDLLGTSYDNTGDLGANSWRHVAFIEQRVPARSMHEDMDVLAAAGGGTAEPDADTLSSSKAENVDSGDLGMPTIGAPQQEARDDDSGVRWLMSSDVCKHCTHAACLDVCPTGSLFRTEFGTVVVQEDICNGCGYCVPACPYGVIEKRESDGRAFKCTLCYDRLGAGMEPACAKACPTDSIQFGELDELRERAAQRQRTLHDAGVTEARLYGHDPDDGVGGDGAFFLLLDEPEVYGLPPDPIVTTRDLPAMWKGAALTALGVATAVVASFAGGRR
jgi:formate dehydrogenase iron-sulfur subunit